MDDALAKTLIGKLSKGGDGIGVAIAIGLAGEGKPINLGKAVLVGEITLSLLVRGLLESEWPGADVERIVGQVAREAERYTTRQIARS